MLIAITELKSIHISFRRFSISTLTYHGRGIPSHQAQRHADDDEFPDDAADAVPSTFYAFALKPAHAVGSFNILFISDVYATQLP